MIYEFIDLIVGNILVCWNTILEFGMGDVDTFERIFMLLLVEYKGFGIIEGGLLDDCTWSGGLWNLMTGDEMIFCVLIIIGGIVITFYVVGIGGWWNENVPVICGDNVWLRLLVCIEFWLTSI